MRRLAVLLALSALAQGAQTSVDVGIRSLVFEKGEVRALVYRKDPSGSTPAREVRARVVISVKGQAPFYSSEVSLKPGASMTVVARYLGSAPVVVFVATITPIGLKELAQIDNRRESSMYKTGANPSPNQRPANQPNPNQPNPNQPNPNQPAPPPPPAPAPLPAPPPPPAPRELAPTIAAPTLTLIGGEQHAVAASPTGTSITAPALTLIGGAQRTPSTVPSGAINIVTPPLVLIGRD